MGYRALALLSLCLAACGLSITGIDATSSATGGDSGTSSVDTTTEGGPGDDDDGGVAVEGLDADTGDAGTTLFDGGGSDAAAATCNPTATIFWDSDDGNKPSAQGLHDAMIASHKFTDVALGGAIGGYHGGGGATDPHGKGVVVLLLGHSTQVSMPSDGQQAVADQVSAGVGLVTSSLFDIVFDSANDPLSQFSLSSTLDYVVLGGTLHLNFTDALFANTFTTTQNVPFEGVKAKSGVTVDATVTSSTTTTPIVLSTERGGTRITECALTIDYPHDQGPEHAMPKPAPPDDSLNKDANVKALFTNMAAWAAHCP